MSNVPVGLRELKQNPSDVISRAESGTRFDVVRNGRATNVVIQLRDAPRMRWVSREAFAEALAEIAPDRTGWLDLNDSLRNNDPITDPWSETR